MLYNFSVFEPKINLELFLSTKVVASSENERNTFKSLMMFYFIMK